MIRKAFLFGVVPLLLAAEANASPPTLGEPEAAELVRTFCATLIPEIAGYDPNDPDAPNPNDLAIFGPLVTPELSSAIMQVRQLDSALPAEGEKPSVFGDGIPWKGHQDAASDCVAGTITGTPERRQVDVVYTYDIEPDEQWTDRLVLSRSGAEWRIDDVLYEAFDYTTGLRSVLVNALSEEVGPEAEQAAP